MPTKVLVPEMGEGVIEVTVIQWLVKEGDTVEQYQALIEVNTDKVDSEIPSPVAGTVLKILAAPDELAPVDSILCWIGEPGEEIPANGGGETAAPVAAKTPEPVAQPAAMPTPAIVQTPVSAAPTPTATGTSLSGFVSPIVARIAGEMNVDLSRVQGTGNGGRITRDDIMRFVQSGGQAAQASAPTPSSASSPQSTFISPVVARLSAQHGINLQTVKGTGKDGRITKKDIQRVVDAGGVDPRFIAVPAPAAPAISAPPQTSAAPVAGQPTPGTMFKLNTMRKSIAKHMVKSVHTSPHVTTIMEADLSAVSAHRAANKALFAQDGAKLTFTAYFVSAVVTALKAYPIVNSSWSDEGLLIHKDINVGMAAALESDGLIVPVIKQADGLSLLGIARAVNDLAERARGKQLKPDEVRGGTFTITNHGTSGSLFATPIINQPQCGILGTGMIQKRAVVINDAIAIRPMVYIGLTFDHRILDGAVADYFLGTVKSTLENWA